MCSNPEDHDFSFGDPAAVMRDRLLDALVEDELDTIDGPHVVECRVIGSADVSYVGPFPTGLAALAHAEHETRRLCAEDRMEYVVLALDVPPGP